MKIITVLGARPQFVKAAVVSRAIATFNELQPSLNVKEMIIHTGQHFDENMSQVFFDQMRIPAPDYHLNISGSSHGAMTGRMLEKIESVLMDEKPDVVLVYGDTNSTLAGALAAAKLHIPVAHVEAGLRSFNMRMPEEINRVLTDQVSKWLFCPTHTAVNNLAQEGMPRAELNDGRHAFNVGDVMYDAMKFYQTIAKSSELIDSLCSEFHDGFCLATVHRAENTDDVFRLESIMEGLNNIGSDCPVILPLHPRTQKKLGNTERYKNIRFIEPVPYFDILTLLSHCNAVLTDSGGMQKEAYFFNKPCVTLRDETEWVELVDGGHNVLAGADVDKICSSYSIQIDKKHDWNDQLYGDGHAAEKIVDILVRDKASE